MIDHCPICNKELLFEKLLSNYITNLYCSEHFRVRMNQVASDVVIRIEGASFIYAPGARYVQTYFQDDPTGYHPIELPMVIESFKDLLFVVRQISDARVFL
jgi:hypothetical protein